MDDEIKKHVRGCKGCILVSQSDPPEPLTRRELPDCPWQDLAIDFLGPFRTGENLLVIVDYYSRYKEVKIMRSITAAKVIEELNEVFVRLGFPRSITLDNGRQFACREFDDYCLRQKIILNKTTPYFPQENGEVERQNRSLLKRMRISQALNRDWKKDLQHYLLMYYTTPHSVTGRTPSELMFGRTIRSRLPRWNGYSVPRPMADFIDRDKALKERGKVAEDEKRHAKKNELMVGDKVYMKNQLPTDKLESRFKETDATVIDRSGSRLTVRDDDTGRVYRRHVTHVKKAPDAVTLDNQEPEPLRSPVSQRPRVTRSPVRDSLTEPSDAVTGDRLKRVTKPPGRFADHVLYHVDNEAI